jgi:very-short-patch-repair endonuclease
VHGKAWSRDAVIAELATRQHGVVARRQLLALGIGDGAIDGRRAKGWFHPLHRGVYAVGHTAIGRHGHWMAAVLAGGPGAALSHSSGGALLEMAEEQPGTIHVTIPRSGRSRPGIRFHASRLPPDERGAVDGIPVTSPARTILDLAATAGRAAAEQALLAAEARHPRARDELTALLARRPGRAGARAARALIEKPRAFTRSELERRFLALVRAAGLPEPEVNARVGGFEVDCVWPPERVAVELDGHAFHASRAAYEGDRARDRALQAAGWRVVRITWRQLAEEPHALIADLRALLVPRL